MEMCCGRKFSLTEGGCFDLALVDYLGVGLATSLLCSPVSEINDFSCMPTRCGLAASGVHSGKLETVARDCVRRCSVLCYGLLGGRWSSCMASWVAVRACGRRNIFALSFICRNQRFVAYLYNTLRKENGRWLVWGMTTVPRGE